MGRQGSVQSSTDADIQQAGPENQQGAMKAILVKQKADEDRQREASCRCPWQTEGIGQRPPLVKIPGIKEN